MSSKKPQSQPNQQPAKEPTGEDIKNSVMDLINKLNMICHSHSPVPGHEHDNRNKVVSAALQELSKWEFVKKEEPKPTSQAKPRGKGGSK